MAVDPHNPTFELPTREPDGSLSPYPTTQPTVTYSVSGLPAGATFDVDTVLFSWTPGNTQAGTYNVVFYATNDGYGGPSDEHRHRADHRADRQPSARRHAHQRYHLDCRAALRPVRPGDGPRRQPTGALRHQRHRRLSAARRRDAHRQRRRHGRSALQRRPPGAAPPTR